MRSVDQPEEVPLLGLGLLEGEGRMTRRLRLRFRQDLRQREQQLDAFDGRQLLITCERTSCDKVATAKGDLFGG